MSKMVHPHENIFSKKKSPEGPAECTLSGLSLPEACSNLLDHGCCPSLAKLK